MKWKIMRVTRITQIIEVEAEDGEEAITKAHEIVQFSGEDQTDISYEMV